MSKDSLLQHPLIFHFRFGEKECHIFLYFVSIVVFFLNLIYILLTSPKLSSVFFFIINIWVIICAEGKILPILPNIYLVRSTLFVAIIKNVFEETQRIINSDWDISVRVSVAFKMIMMIVSVDILIFFFKTTNSRCQNQASTKI